MPGYITRIRRVVKQILPTKTLVLVMDCAPSHRERGVLNHCSRLGVHVLFIPAKLTYLLQPLDSHTFAIFKHKLCAEQLLRRQATADGANAAGDWVGAVQQATLDVLVRRNWQHAFAANGLPPSRGILREAIVSVSETGGPWLCSPPTDEEFSVLVNARTAGLREALLRLPFRMLDKAKPLFIIPIARLPARARLPPAPLPPPVMPPGDDESPLLGIDAVPAGASSSAGVRRTRSGAMY